MPVTYCPLCNTGVAFERTFEGQVLDFGTTGRLRFSNLVMNEADREREVRLLFAQDFHISGHEVGDSAYYEPERRAVFHYKGKRWFMINTAKEEPDGWTLGVDQWAVGIKEAQCKDGTWRDAEDGHLSGNAVAQGSVDSAVALHLTVPAHGQATGWYWIAPDGSLASSWHGWYQDGRKELPVQEDETALVLWALWRHLQRFRDIEFIKPHYRGLIVRAANWLTEYRDKDSGLPPPLWDLWEERRGVLAWTVGATWGGLQAAANFADAFGEDDLAATYRRAADEIRAG